MSGIISQSPSTGLAALDTIADKLKNPFRANVKNTGERPQDFPQGFVIIEYVNGLPQTDKAIKLLGNLMPFQPFEWAGEQRIVKEYYPGNDEPAVQLLGAKEDPVTIRGRFKDKRYNDASLYGVSYMFALALEELRIRGNLIKFGMNGMAGHWFRYGYLQKTDFKMKQLSWVDYELTFEVVSFTLPRNNYFAAPEKQAPDQINSTLLTAAASFQSTYSAVPTSMPQSLAGTLNGIISNVATQINKVTDFVTTALDQVEDIASVANRAMGLIKNARTQLVTYQRQIGAITYSFSNLTPAGSSGNAINQATSTQGNIAYFGEICAAMNNLIGNLEQMRGQFANVSQTTPITRYKVQSGDSLQKISVKFYGVQDNWTKIYDHNQLTSTVLTPGKVLEIPKL